MDTALERIAKLKVQIEDCHIEINNIRNCCKHEYRPSNPKWLDSSSPRCWICGDVRDGWWCEASPTKECDYSKPSGRGYNPDSCRYCHQPEERK